MPTRSSEDKFHVPDENIGGMRKGLAKRKCVVCGHQSIFFCMGCGRDVVGTEVYICNPKRDKGRDCWKKVHDMRKSRGANRSKLFKKRTVTFY